jgi:hypothetical protein
MTGSTPPSIAAEIEATLDVLLDAASATGGRVRWGRTWLRRRHWVAVELLDGHVRTRRARTRAEAAYRLLRDVYPGFGTMPFWIPTTPGR